MSCFDDTRGESAADLDELYEDDLTPTHTMRAVNIKHDDCWCIDRFDMRHEPYDRLAHIHMRYNTAID